MSYVIASHNCEIGTKKQGDQVTEKELLEAGLNINALVAGGHISGNKVTTPAQEGAAK
jgi:hypothetical protein